MRVDVGAPVVVVDAAPTLVHSPAPLKIVAVGGNGGRREFPLQEALDRSVLHWPTVCGLEGYLFIYDGVIRRNVDDGARHFCAVCLERVKVAA